MNNNYFVDYIKQELMTISNVEIFDISKISSLESKRVESIMAIYLAFNINELYLCKNNIIKNIATYLHNLDEKLLKLFDNNDNRINDEYIKYYLNYLDQTNFIEFKDSIKTQYINTIIKLCSSKNINFQDLLDNCPKNLYETDLSKIREIYQLVKNY